MKETSSLGVYLRYLGIPSVDKHSELLNLLGGHLQ